MNAIPMVSRTRGSATFFIDFVARFIGVFAVGGDDVVLGHLPMVGSASAAVDDGIGVVEMMGLIWGWKGRGADGWWGLMVVGVGGERGGRWSEKGGGRGGRAGGGRSGKEGVVGDGFREEGSGGGGGNGGGGLLVCEVGFVFGGDGSGCKGGRGLMVEGMVVGVGGERGAGELGSGRGLQGGRVWVFGGWVRGGGVLGNDG